MATFALDYDGTYTLDPAMWDQVIALMRAADHKVYVVTMRYPIAQEANEVNAALKGKVDELYFTGRKAKRAFMYDKGIHISVWMDDQPDFILHGASS